MLVCLCACVSGGFGWNTGVAGLACERVIGVDAVLASGELVYATPHNEYSDLLWAARGAGCGFWGVVTKFSLQAYPKPKVTGFVGAFFSIDALADVGIDYCSPEAAAASAAFTGLRSATGHLIGSSGSGRMLADAGRRDAIDHAIDLDVSGEVPVLRNHPPADTVD